MTGRIPRAVMAALCLACAVPPAPALAADRTEADASTKSLYLLLIRQARTDGRARAALAYLDDFERKYPGDLDAQVLRVNCLLDLGQVEAAEAALEQLPGNDRSGKVQEVRGHVFTARKQWPAAIAAYQAALQADPANSLTINALGYAQMRAGQAQAAVETLKGAADIAPTNTVIRNNLLLALTMAGRPEEAGAVYRTIRDPEARSTLQQQVFKESVRLASLKPLPTEQEN